MDPQAARLKLAQSIVECRRQLRSVSPDDATVRAIRAKLDGLEKQLREIDA
jgi:hypothetical protein